MEIFLFILTSYGITNIVVFGHIFEGLRNLFNRLNPNFLGQLFSCPLCFSTWVGFILSYILTYLNLTQLTPFGYIGLDLLWVRVFLDGCLTSGTVWLIHTFQEYLESRD